MPMPGFEDSVDGRRKGKFSDKRKRGQYAKNRKLRSFDHNHGFHGQRPLHDQPPFRYDSPGHDIPHRPPESDYYISHGPDSCQRPPDHDMYRGHPAHEMYGDRLGPDRYHHHSGYNMNNGPPMPGMHGGPPPPMPDMHKGPPMPDMHNGPPMPDMHNGPPMPDLHNGPLMPDMHNCPPMPDMHNRPLMHNVHNGPPIPNMPNGPVPGPDIYHGPPHRDIQDGPLNSNRFLGPSCSDYHHGLRKPEIYNGPMGPDRYHASPDIGMQGTQGPEMHFRPQGPDNHFVPPGCNIGSESRDDVFHRLPVSDMDCGPHSDNFHGPPGPVLCNGPPSGERYCRPGGYDNHHGLPGNDICHGANRADICHRPNGPNNLDPHLGLSPRGPETCHEPQPRDIAPNSKVTDISNNPPIHEYPSGHSHHSPLYPGMHLHHTPPLSVPPPPFIPMQVSSVLSYPRIEPSYPPLPQTPPSDQRPPPPPSPCPPSPRPPSPQPPPPRPPSPTSPPPLSPAGEDSVTVKDEPYDPAEALFSPASSSDSPEMNDKQRESIINKYVRHAQKLTSCNNVQLSNQPEANFDIEKKIVRNLKVVKNSQEPKKTDIVKKCEESPARPSLDARLKLMFGATSEKESPKKGKKRASKIAQDSKGDIKELSRPLSPPPSPFRSKQMYHYWHNVTLKMRKSSKVVSNDFVNANMHSGIKDIKREKNKNSDKPISVTEPFQRPTLPLPKVLPTVPPPSSNSDVEKVPLNDPHLKMDSVLKSNDRPHPYKLAGSKDRVVQHSLDTEFELTCEGPLHGNSSDKDFLESGDLARCSIEDCRVTSDEDDDESHGHDTIHIGGDSDMVDGESCSENKTISIVLSKILEDLKNEIRMQLTSEILDKPINSLIDEHKF
ncbi:atrophin-1-like [Macrobrachium rosenbergii]|uniref:atrophin-1-like n=1 Tax=Macrobrachium rosenbergii TaxID=79674 RepID=UPI0034D6ED31